MAAAAMTSVQPLRWDLLDGQMPTGERLLVRLAAPQFCRDVYIAVDASGGRYLLVELPVEERAQVAERASRGIAVRTVELSVGVGQQSLSRFLEIACLDDEGRAALDTIADDVIQRLRATPNASRGKAVREVLAKWRRFWGATARRLSREQVLGLVGELWFLNFWLAPAAGPVKAVAMWRGPFGARNDFESHSLAIEVKASARTDGVHMIHGIEQLLEPPAGSLYLFSLFVREEASATVTLPGLVATTMGLVSKNAELTAQLENALYACGYDSRDDEEYLRMAVRIREQRLYKIQPGFPRLVPQSLSGALPPGVGNISYELQVAAAASWMVADEPTSGRAFLEPVIGPA